MATRKELQQEGFITLVNKQLEPFNKTYHDVVGDPEWYTRYIVTPEQEEEFMKWGTEYIMKKFRMTKKGAEQEMSWFILQWGLKSTKIINSKESIEATQNFINKLNN